MCVLFNAMAQYLPRSCRGERAQFGTRCQHRCARRGSLMRSHPMTHRARGRPEVGRGRVGTRVRGEGADGGPIMDTALARPDWSRTPAANACRWLSI